MSATTIAGPPLAASGDSRTQRLGASEVAAAYGQIDALNWSTLSRLAVSPLLLRYRVEHPEPEKTAYRLGRAVHCAVLEPVAWPTRYVAAPDVDRRTKAGREQYEAWQSDLPPGAETLTAEEHAVAETCAAAVAHHGIASSLLRGGRAEEVVTWDDPQGIACKGRLDYITPAHLVDLKTTRRSSVREFARDVAAFHYYGQVAWYLDGARAARVLPDDAEAYIVAVQTVEPYDVAAFRLPPAVIEAGRALYRDLLRRYVECRAADWWPGMAPGLIDLELPRWADAPAPPDDGGDW